MDENLRRENNHTLSKIASGVTFPYVWLGLFMLLNQMYNAQFFGAGLEGDLVAVLLCLGVLNPLVPLLIVQLVARPIFLNLLARKIVSGAGCLVGLGAFLLMALGVVYFLSRDLSMAWQLFIMAPVVGGILAGLLSAVPILLKKVHAARASNSPSSQSSPRQLPNRGNERAKPRPRSKAPPRRR